MAARRSFQIRSLPSTKGSNCLETERYFQKLMQTCLPCHVTFEPIADADKSSHRTGFKCRISSYINNLHLTEHPGLYRVIEVIECAIPLWNTTLTALRNDPRPRRINCQEVKYDLNPETMSESEWPQQEEGEDDDDFQERSD